MTEFSIDFLTHFAAASIAVALYRRGLHQRYTVTKKLPYRYICAHEDCNYHSSSTEMEWVDRDALAHERWHEGGEHENERPM